MSIDIAAAASAELPAPASPFDKRPAPAASDASTSSDEKHSPSPNSPISVSAPITGRIAGPSYPLSSFASTPHNVACIGFVLGSVWCFGLVRLFIGPKWVIWSPTSATVADLEPQGLLNALRSPILGLYLACWALFHLLEFVVTSMWNPGKLTVGSFLLDNGMAYHIAHTVGIIEHILEDAFLPAKFRLFKHTGGLVLLGFALLVAGQILRSFAMISASSNFSHIVAHDKLPSHQLVKTGIYAWSRHPSYAGFTWWAVGTQVMLANPFGAFAFSLVLYEFFSKRIIYEEKHLVKFFGDDYIKYRAEVPTRIPFVP